MPAEPDKIQNFIDGRFVEPVGGRYLDNIEPATGKLYSQVADSDAADVELAVAAAERAFPDWSRTPASERSRILLRIADLIERDLEKLAHAESIDTGKPLSLARTLDIPRAVGQLPLLRDRDPAHASPKRTSPMAVAFNYTLRQPRGVVGTDLAVESAALSVDAGKSRPPSRVGNTAVAKPCELTPMTAYLLGEICREAGLPPGVLNIVHGTGPKVGAAITAHPKIGDDFVHRRHRDRPQGGRDLRAAVQESLARTGRQESEHHLCRRRPGRGDRRQRALVLRKPGPGLPVRFAHLRRALGLHRFRRSLCCGGVAS